jgi:hypothetical protein
VVKRLLRTAAHDRLAAALAPLRDDRDVTVLRDVRVHRGNVGHVVICPGGVYVLEPRRWRGKVELRGGRVMRGAMGIDPAARDVGESATRIRRRLASSGIVRNVGSVIAVLGGTVVEGPIDLRTLEVVEASMLPAWVRGRVPRMRPIELEAIRQALTPHDQVPWRPM